MNGKSMLHIVGPYPPPFGGVSIHISRLLPYLIESNINYKVFDQYGTRNELLGVFPTEKKLLWWIKYFFSKKATVTHFHHFSFFIYFYAYFFSKFFNTKVIVTIHNENILNGGFFQKKIATLLIRKSNAVKYIIVSYNVFEHLRKRRCSNVEYLPAYIPPLSVSLKKLPKNNSKNIFFNAWRLNDKLASVYGFDFFCRLAKFFPLYDFYCFVGDGKSAKFVYENIERDGLNNLIVMVGCNLVDYLGDATVFLRLNREDAYGVSVKEALDSGVPAIASDVCQRANGSLLFSNNDFEDLLKVFKAAEANGFKLDTRLIETTEYHLQLIELYKKYLG